MQKRLGTDGDGKDSGPGWTIKTLGIEYGRLTSAAADDDNTAFP